MGKILELTNVHSYYGHIHALKGVSLYVDEGEIVSLIGSNGAGKSTTLRTISGLLHAKEGTVKFGNKDITHMEPHLIVGAGVGHVPEGRGIFPKLTVRENLDMGAYAVEDQSKNGERMEQVFQLFPRLRERIDQYGGTLSGGEQQMLAIGRGLMLHPRILMLVELIFDIIKKLNEDGTTILLVEQNALMALSIAHRGYVLQTGEIALTNTAEKLKKDEMVQKSYLGIE